MNTNPSIDRNMDPPIQPATAMQQVKHKENNLELTGRTEEVALQAVKILQSQEYVQLNQHCDELHEKLAEALDWMEVCENKRKLSEYKAKSFEAKLRQSEADLIRAKETIAKYQYYQPKCDYLQYLLDYKAVANEAGIKKLFQKLAELREQYEALKAQISSMDDQEHGTAANVVSASASASTSQSETKKGRLAERVAEVGHRMTSFNFEALEEYGRMCERKAEQLLHADFQNERDLLKRSYMAKISELNARNEQLESENKKLKAQLEEKKGQLEGEDKKPRGAVEKFKSQVEAAKQSQKKQDESES